MEQSMLRSWPTSPILPIRRMPTTRMLTSRRSRLRATLPSLLRPQETAVLLLTMFSIARLDLGWGVSGCRMSHSCIVTFKCWCSYSFRASWPTIDLAFFRTTMNVHSADIAKTTRSAEPSIQTVLAASGVDALMGSTALGSVGGRLRRLRAKVRGRNDALGDWSDGEKERPWTEKRMADVLHLSLSFGALGHCYQVTLFFLQWVLHLLHGLHSTESPPPPTACASVSRREVSCPPPRSRSRSTDVDARTFRHGGSPSSSMLVQTSSPYYSSTI